MRAISTKAEEKITTADIECGLANYFRPRVNMLIPNVSWGFGIHECDVLVITKSGYLYEVEIKISASDLKRDADKPHKHESKKIKNLYFAIPYYLLSLIDYIPARAGVLSFSKRPMPLLIREPISQPVHKITDKELLTLYRLAALRVWDLKMTNTKLQRETSANESI